MASEELLRKDSNGHIISKTNKDYHICFKEIIDIIDVKSYKKYNKMREGSSDETNCGEEEEEEEEDDDNEKNKSFIEDYQKTNIENCSNKDPKSFSKGGCYIF